jgi:hypothetical protein
VALTEKAYAHFRTGANSYDSLGWGWMTGVYEEMTNVKPTSQSTGGLSEQELYDYFAGSLADGHAVSLGSYSSATGPIVASHAYVVQSVETTSEGMFVTVYNPWGFDGRSWDGNSGDGLLTLSIGQIQTYFGTACVSQA